MVVICCGGIYYVGVCVECVVVGVEGGVVGFYDLVVDFIVECVLWSDF